MTHNFDQGVEFGRWKDPTCQLIYHDAMPYLTRSLPLGERVLDLGGGNGLTAELWPDRNVTTVDIDPAKHPDIEANILDYTHPTPVDTVLLRYVLHYLSDTEVLQLLDQIGTYHHGPLIIIQFANTNIRDKTENSADDSFKHWRTPAGLLDLLTSSGWTLGKLNRLDYQVPPGFYTARLGIPGKYPHQETLMGFDLTKGA